MISSTTYLKEDFLGCGINNKVVIEFLKQRGGKLDTCPFRGLFIINKIHPDNSSFITIIKMYHDPNNSTKTLIHSTHLLLRLKWLVIDQK